MSIQWEYDGHHFIAAGFGPSSVNEVDVSGSTQELPWESVKQELLETIALIRRNNVWIAEYLEKNLEFDDEARTIRSTVDIQELRNRLDRIRAFAPKRDYLGRFTGLPSTPRAPLPDVGGQLDLVERYLDYESDERARSRQHLNTSIDF